VVGRATAAGTLMAMRPALPAMILMRDAYRLPAERKHRSAGVMVDFS
jgi:hypothetical protein